MNNQQQGSKLALAALSTVPILMVLGNSMLIPEFPKIKAALDITQFQVGLFITLFSATAGLTIPILGFLSDQYGRKIIIIPAVLIYGIGGVISGLGATILGESYSIILVGRIVQGFGAAGSAPIVMAMVGDLYKSNARSEAMGIIEAANGLGKVLSPILGSLVALIAWWALFFSYAIIALPIALIVYFWTKEPKHKKPKNTLAKYLKDVWQIFKKTGLSLLVTLLAGMTVLFLLFGVLSHVSDVLEKDYDLRGLIKGLIIAIPILFMSIFSYLTGRYLKGQNQYFKMIIILGLFIVGGALFFLPFVHNIYIYISILTFLGLGSGLVLPTVNTLITSSSDSQQRGGLTSLYGSFRFLGVAIGPPTFSLLLEISQKMMFWSGTIIALIILGLVFSFLNEKKLISHST